MDALRALQSMGIRTETEGHSGEKLLQQAQQLWSMLDEMAEKDPQAYKKFLEKQKKEFEEANAPPKPHMCIRTKAQNGDGQPLFVNLLSWSKVPKPKSEQDSIPMFASPVDSFRDKKVKETVSTIAIAVNPEVLEECCIQAKDSSDRNAFINLALDYAQHLCKCQVDRNFFILPQSIQFKGDLEKAQQFFQDALKNAMKKKQKPDDVSKDATDLNIPDTMLARLANIAKHGATEEMQNTAPHSSASSAPPVIFPETYKEAQSPKKKLIQEITSEEAMVSAPKYTLERSPSGLSLVLQVELPGVKTVSDCQLDISEDDVKLSVEGKYDLAIQLPEHIDENDAKAKFNKKQSLLTLCMPVQQM